MQPGEQTSPSSSCENYTLLCNWIKPHRVNVPRFLYPFICCLLIFCPGTSQSLSLSSNRSWVVSLEFPLHAIILSPETVFFQLAFSPFYQCKHLNIWKQVALKGEWEPKVAVLFSQICTNLSLCIFCHNMSFPFYRPHLGVHFLSLCSWFNQNDDSY